jgi:hypothetical protein
VEQRVCSVQQSGYAHAGRHTGKKRREESVQDSLADPHPGTDHAQSAGERRLTPLDRTARLRPLERNHLGHHPLTRIRRARFVSFVSFSSKKRAEINSVKSFGKLFYIDALLCFF